MKVAIIGSRMYENTRKVKDTLFNLKQKFGSSLIIISGGAKDGADKFARKYALEFGIKYKEFNPAHTIKNLYSAMSDTYYERDCNVMIAFIPSGESSSGSMSAIKQAKKLNKPVTIIS